MHLLISWERLCRSKPEGALGFASLRDRNAAMLFKWWWRCARERNKFWHNLVRNKFGLDFELGLANLEPNDASSFILKDI